MTKIYDKNCATKILWIEKNKNKKLLNSSDSNSDGINSDNSYSDGSNCD